MLTIIFSQQSVMQTPAEAPASFKRINRELQLFQKDPPDGCNIEMLDWNNLPCDKEKIPFQWLIDVRGMYEIVVLFPTDYPFKAPYYMIRVRGNVLMSLKQYLVSGADEKSDAAQVPCLCPSDPVAILYALARRVHVLPAIVRSRPHSSTPVRTCQPRNAPFDARCVWVVARRLSRRPNALPVFTAS